MGVQPVGGPQHGAEPDSLRKALPRSSLPGEATADRGATWDRLAYVDSLLEELEEAPPVPARRRRTGPILLGMGLVLVGIGVLGATVAPTEEAFLSFVLGVNVLAVLCVATGILLLPESPAPIHSVPSAAGLGRWFRRGMHRIRGHGRGRPVQHTMP